MKMKQYVNYRLADIDFKEERYRFCRIELVRIGRETIQLTSTSGRLGTKGKRTLMWESLYTEENLNEAIERARQHLKAKKGEGFRFESDLTTLLGKERQGNCCDGCGTEIPDDLYAKINEWARGDGGWDRETTCPGKGKVFCIPCQTEHGLYRKRLRHGGRRGADRGTRAGRRTKADGERTRQTEKGRP